MTCDITKIQNQQSSLIELAAMRQIYAEAKRWFGWQFSLSIFPAVGWAFVLLLWPDLKVVATVCAIVLTLIENLLFEVRQKQLLKMAARIQETFDCDTLCLDWNSVKIGSRPDTEDINAAANRYKKQTRDVHYRKLTNWYRTTLDQLPIHQARILAQRSSLRWDMDLRRKYRTWVVAITAIVGVLLVCAGLVAGPTFNNFILIFLGPWVPALIWGVKEFRKQDATIQKLEELKANIEGSWTDALNATKTPEELTRCARSIQDEMFHHRCTSTPIVEWVYDRLKDPQEEDMHAAVDARVKEALGRSQSP